jgi:ubiquinone/menaquinone biosynthesis C-methylase UbiE
MKTQVDKSHYKFETYINKNRFSSYYYQLKYIERLNPYNFLEIGGGAGILKKLIPDNIKYFNVDVSKELNPDIIATVEQLPFKDNEFDLVGCFQVLEHLPFEKFSRLLEELGRVCSGNVLISLPYANHKIMVEITLPKSKMIALNIIIPKFYKPHKFDGQHYWEIGKKNYSQKKIRRIIENIFKVKEIFTPKENTYHTFFLLEKL